MRQFFLLFGAAATVSVGLAQVARNSYDSPISAIQRTSAVQRLEQIMREKGAKETSVYQALQVLQKRAIVVEPLGTDSKGNSAFRVIQGGRNQSGKWIGISPVFAADRGASQDIADFIATKPTAYAGLDPDSHVIYIRAEKLNDVKSLPAIVTALNELAEK